MSSSGPLSISPTLRTPKQLADEFDLPIGGIRHWLFHRETNGLERAVLQVGRKILMDKEAFVTWLLSHRKAATKGDF